VVFTFKPKSGELERELLTLFEESKADTLIVQADKSDGFINKILLGWSDSQNRMPPFPEDKQPARLWNQDEKGQLINLWNKANALTVGEKKL